MKSRLKLTRSEKRAQKKLKQKNAPKGAKLAGQIQKMRTSKNYVKKKRKSS